MLAYSETDEKYNEVRKVLNFLLAVMGIIFLGYATHMIITDFDDFFLKRNLVDFVLPLLLTIMFTPFIYLIALYSSYETLFLRMPFFIADKNVLSYSKKKTFISFGFNIKKLNEWAKHLNTHLINEKKDIDEAIILFKKNSAIN
jgi:hypothetical protein